MASVSREWLVRLEQGHHRVELGRVMRVVEALGYGLEPTEVESVTSDLLSTMLANTRRDTN